MSEITDEERANDFRELWNTQRVSVDAVNGHKIGVAWIKHVLGLDEATAAAFTARDREAWHQVGMRQAAVPGSNLRAFWDEISSIFPEAYSADDIKFLVSPGGTLAAIVFMVIMDNYGRSPSQILVDLSRNAHAYK